MAFMIPLTKSNSTCPLFELPDSVLLIFLLSELVQYLWSKLLRQELAHFVDLRNGI